MQKNTYNNALRAARRAARNAGERILKSFRSKRGVIRKSARELVTKSDVASQRIIVDILSRATPEYDIVSEEKRAPGAFQRPTWVIDPLDGTHNFISGIPLFAVSIGLVEDGECKLGVIYLPLEKKLFSAQKGGGTFCNGKKIRVSSNKHLGRAMVTYDNQFYLDRRSFDRYRKLIGAAFTTRVLGSAARDLCFIAEGVVDARIWNNAKLCDVAAGIVIVEEAGGKVTDFEGRNVRPDTKHIIASNALIHKELLGVLQ